MDESPGFELLSRIPGTHRGVSIPSGQGSLPGGGLGHKTLGMQVLGFLSVHNLQDDRNQARRVYGAGK